MVAGKVTVGTEAVANAVYVTVWQAPSEAGPSGWKQYVNVELPTTPLG